MRERASPLFTYVGLKDMSRVEIVGKIFLCVISIISLMGCKEENYSVSIKREEIYMDVNSARNLPAIVSPSDADVAYHSSDESIAWYANDILISGKAGTCVVYAQAGDAVSGLVTVHVHDYLKEAGELRQRIEKLYKEGNMSEFIAMELSLRYDTFPDYAKSVVDNFYIVSMFRDYSDEKQVYITQSGKKYHEPGCDRLEGHVRAIPYNLALLEGMTACTVCN